MKVNKINIGEIILGKVEEAGISKAKFAELVGLKRQNIDKTVFQKHGIDTDLLCVISEVLQCNFFDYFKNNDTSNQIDYKKEVKATLSIEMGMEKQDKTFRFIFGDNDIEILNK